MSFFNDLYQFVRRLKYVAKNVIGLPLVGEFGDRFLVDPPKLISREFGKTSVQPSVLEILIQSDSPGPLDVGDIVDETYFESRPPIVFNVCFACARPSLLFGGDYANPNSHWFNVFFGFYEIDVAKERWGRPFGFKGADSDDLEFDDLFKIGKSDWNYFSNYVYGVPKEECDKYKEVSDEIETRVIDPKVTIAGREYVEAQAEGMTVVTGYVSGKDGKRLHYNDGFWSAVWRTAFGRPKPQANFKDSFIPAKMRMRFYIRFEEGYDEDLGEVAYKTFIYGGTVNLDYKGEVDNEAFLAAQMEGVRHSAEKLAFRKNPKSKSKARWRR